MWINYKKEAFTRMGVDFVTSKQIFFELQADLGGGLMLLIITFGINKQDDIFLHGNKKLLLLCILSGIIGVFSAQLCFCLGLTLSDAGFTAPWMLLSPIFTTILGLLLKYEESKPLKTAGLVLSILGTTGLIIYSRITSNKSESTSAYLAILFLFLSSLSNSCAVIIWKKLLIENKVTPLIVSTWSLLVGSIFMLIAFSVRPYWYPWKTVNSLSQQFYGCYQILSCCFIIMLGYCVTYCILIWATRKSSISIVAIYASARPIFTVVLSFMVNQQMFLDILVSTLLLTLVLLGLCFASQSKRIEKKGRLVAQRNDFRKKLEFDFKRIPVGSEKPCDSPPNYIKIT
jgi:drug/metabolite transporter (DMT)-like permease